MSPSGTGPQLSRQQAEELYQDLLAAASRRRRRRTIVRVVGVAVSAVFMLVALIWATVALSGLGHRTMVGSGNEEPRPNYRFEKVTVTEYVDPRTGEVDPGKAGILGTIRWTSDAYPGVHECTYTAYGPDGSVVGEETSEVDSLSEGGRHPIPIAVTGVAVSAKVSCDPVRLDTPAAYTIADARLEPKLDPQTGDLVGATVVFKVIWPEWVRPPAFPGANACRVRITRPSGELLTVYLFSLSGAPPGRLQTPLIELSELGSISLDEISTLGAEVSCEPFTGQPRKEPMPGAGTEVSPDYRFKDVQVIYPYVDPPTTEVPDPSRAGVEITPYWTSGEYPGEHQCTLTVYGPNGTTVGSLETRLSSLSEGHWRHPIAVDVTGEATSAAITCDPTRLDTPVAYIISGTAIEPLVEGGRVAGIRYTYTVDAPEDVRPPDFVGTNWCVFSVDAPSGEELVRSPGTLDTPTPNTVSNELRSDPFASMSRAEIGGLTLQVQCEPFTGAPGQAG